MAKNSKTKKAKRPDCKKINFQEEAKKLTPKLFKQLCDVALTKTGTIAGKAAWDKVWEMSGEELKPIPKVIKVKFVDIFADENGDIKESPSPDEDLKSAVINKNSEPDA